MKHERHTLTALVTGFEPFGGDTDNPSWEAVKLVPDHFGGDEVEMNIHRELLPVTFAAAAELVPELIRRYQPDVVIHVGVNGKATSLNVETTAWNEKRASIPDNAGYLAEGEPVEQDGPEQRQSTWSAPVLVGRLRAIDYVADVSHDPGRYVCNATLYSSLATIAEGEVRPTGFLHVPPATVMPSAQVAGAIVRVLGELGSQVLRHRGRQHGSNGLKDMAGYLLRVFAALAAYDIEREWRSQDPILDFVGTDALDVVWRVGVTGGIGSGKSTFAELLTEHGYHVLSADDVARKVVEPGSVLAKEVSQAFGLDLVEPDGALDRAALAEAVFGSDAAKDARQRLDDLIHPAIAEYAAEHLEYTGEIMLGRTAVYDVPLLVETGLEDLLDLVVVVEASEATRLQRLEQRGFTPQQARERMAHQASDAQRRAVADVVINNDGTLEDLAERARQFVESLPAV